MQIYMHLKLQPQTHEPVYQTLGEEEEPASKKVTSAHLDRRGLWQ